MEDMMPEDRSLLESAIGATKGSYAPFSHYNVGAAVLLSDGTVVQGANQENAAFPSGLCAERTALFAAHAQHPELAVRALAVTACRNGRMAPEPAWPCGACRQVLAETQKRAEAPSVSSWEASAVLSCFPRWTIFCRLFSMAVLFLLLNSFCEIVPEP